MIDEEEIEDALFWANLHGIKDVEFKRIRDWLAHRGYVPPAHPSDAQLTRELETLLDRLADLGVVVEFIDHLSDRELYTWLMESGHLDGHIALLPNSHLHMSPIGSCSEEDNQIYLTYYASDQEREWWKEDAPDEELPPRKQLPYDREGRRSNAHAS
jgi:hypothetical protein